MRTIILFIYLFFVLIFSGVMILVDKIVKFKPETSYNAIRSVAKHIDAIAGNKYELIGKENIPTEAVFIVANHESFFDPISLVDIFEGPVALIGKAELRKIPTMGYWGMKFGSDFIERDNMKQSIRVIINASKTLKNGTSVLLFPEGTRNIADEEFKAGSFKVAQNAKAGILPVTVRNTSDVFEKNKFFQLKKSKPTITIHPVIKYEDYKEYDLITVSRDVQKIVNSK
ncbi:lysophospholipid acyltransferase family protein [Mollicutes bacterium LVI A0039]|nr:lysophospholipid acyltransferase family protein [Mollicutes bacterium LVI A0039]